MRASIAYPRFNSATWVRHIFNWPFVLYYPLRVMIWAILIVEISSNIFGLISF